ncbi:hypothetical protein KIPB_007292 [Kipferlia bialata]|uniref:Uncharacterized protein n=1 Tax=Kipferlia bialata TaxID=797122 RepID=A0A391NMG2_9EUKA|nr:hypothetical protein KIPB_007292 [Kipferlia bialata]|eukprot:g7292.t1
MYPPVPINDIDPLVRGLGPVVREGHCPQDQNGAQAKQIAQHNRQTVGVKGARGSGRGEVLETMAGYEGYPQVPLFALVALGAA